MELTNRAGGAIDRRGNRFRCHRLTDSRPLDRTVDDLATVRVAAAAARLLLLETRCASRAAFVSNRGLRHLVDQIAASFHAT